MSPRKAGGRPHALNVMFLPLTVGITAKRIERFAAMDDVRIALKLLEGSYWRAPSEIAPAMKEAIAVLRRLAEEADTDDT
jgi:hypothetical protein